MLYSVIVCIAYIIGIIWGLYLDLGLSIVSFFLFICASFLFTSFYPQNNIKFKKIIYVIGFSFILGSTNTIIKEYNFNNKYSPRHFFIKR